MIIFCGLPVIVAVLPTLEAMGIANRYGTGLRLRRATRSSTSGVMTRQIVSLTRKAEKAPATSTIAMSKTSGRLAHATTIAHQPEEARDTKIGDEDHHAEQERDRVEIDRAVSLVERDDA